MLLMVSVEAINVTLILNCQIQGRQNRSSRPSNCRTNNFSISYLYSFLLTKSRKAIWTKVAGYFMILNNNEFAKSVNFFIPAGLVISGTLKYVFAVRLSCIATVSIAINTPMESTAFFNLFLLSFLVGVLAVFQLMIARKIQGALGNKTVVIYVVAMVKVCLAVITFNLPVKCR